MTQDWVYRVYKITRDDKVKYIGITRCLVSTRWNEHRCAARNGRGSTLAQAMRVYSEESFSIEQIASCIDAEEAKRVERLLIKQYKTFGRGGYNRTKGGDGAGRFPRVVSDQERAAIRARNLSRWSDPEYRAKTSANMRGRKMTDALRAKISAEKKGVKMSEETRQKMSESRIGKKHSPEVRARIAEHNRIRNQSEAQRAAIAASWERRKSAVTLTQE